MRIFLDANILFSASFPHSLVADFLGELKKHSVLQTNAYAKTEAERNVSAKIPKRLSACQKFASAVELVPIELFDLDVRLADKDRPILCGAIGAKADYLLTGDKKDFGHLFGRTIMGVKIVSVQMLIADLIKQGIIKEL